MEALSIGRPLEQRDMVEFFINFMKSDQLGQIAVQHRVLADIRPRGTHDPYCILLAELHSTAVDFSKTGIPVDMRKCPRRPKYRPDFEAPGPQVVIEKDMGAVFLDSFLPNDDDQDDEDDIPHTRYYESQKALGILYRAINEKEFYDAIKKREADVTSHSSLIEEVWQKVQVACQGFQWECLLESARQIRET